MTVSRRTLLEWAIRASATPAGIHFFSRWTEAAQSQPATAHSGTSHSGAQSAPDFLATYPPQFFSARDFAALESFTQILIPTDETPGAREAHCAHFVDFLLHSMGTLSPDTQQQWRDALSSLEAAGFHDSSPEQRKSMVAKIAAPELDPALEKSPAFAAYLLIKRETVFAFYTSRAGIIGALDYRGNTYNVSFPACTHPEHHEI